jgi:hypothetical protein
LIRRTGPTFCHRKALLSRELTSCHSFDGGCDVHVIIQSICDRFIITFIFDVLFFFPFPFFACGNSLCFCDFAPFLFKCFNILIIRSLVCVAADQIEQFKVAKTLLIAFTIEHFEGEQPTFPSATVKRKIVDLNANCLAIARLTLLDISALLHFRGTSSQSDTIHFSFVAAEDRVREKKRKCCRSTQIERSKRAK